MPEPTNAEIMDELKGLGGLIQRLDNRLIRMDNRLMLVEADMSVLRSAYANQGKTIGDLLRSTPLPPPEARSEDYYDDYKVGGKADGEADNEDTDEDTNPSISASPEFSLK